VRLLGDDLEADAALLRRLGRRVGRPVAELRRLAAARRTTRARSRGAAERETAERVLGRVLARLDSDVGRPKAVCAAERMRDLDPSVRAIGYAGDFWDILGFDLPELT